MIPFYREAIKNGKAGNLRFPAGIGVMRPLRGKSMTEIGNCKEPEWRS